MGSLAVFIMCFDFSLGRFAAVFIDCCRKGTHCTRLPCSSYGSTVAGLGCRLRFLLLLLGCAISLLCCSLPGRDYIIDSCSFRSTVLPCGVCRICAVSVPRSLLLLCPPVSVSCIRCRLLRFLQSMYGSANIRSTGERTAYICR